MNREPRIQKILDRWEEAVEGGELLSAGALVPTSHTTDSDATLILRREGPAGEVIARQRFTDLVDNAWIDVRCAPQPPGVYYLELAEVVVASRLAAHVR